MLRELIIIVLLILIGASPSGAAANCCDRHDLQLTLEPDSGQLFGRDRIELAETARELVFQLDLAVQVLEVTLDDRPARFQHQGGWLKVINALAGTGQRSITIHYSARFATPPPTQPAHHEDPGFAAVATILPQGSYLPGNLAWYPRRDGLPQTIELQITGPAGYHAVTAGQRIDFTTTAGASTSAWSIQHPVHGLAVSAGPYQVLEARAGDIPLYAYFHAASLTLAEDYLQASADYLELYQELFGRYPFAKFAIVENFFPSGFGFPSWTLLGSSVIRLPFIVKTSLGHEIAHSWWGNGVLVDYREGNWSEGLTTYVADYLYQENISAEAGRDYRRKILRDYATLRDESEIAVAGFISRDDKLSQAIGYGKTAMLFHMIRKEIGDQVFWATLRNTAEQAMHHRVTWSELLEKFSRQSGKPVSRLIRPWLERPGAPQLSLKKVRLEATDSGWQVSGVIVQTQPTFPLRIPLRLTTSSKDSTQVLEATDIETTFVINSVGRPLSLTVDPEFDLFRLLIPEEIPASVNHLRASQQLTVVILPEQRDNLPVLEVLLAGLRQNDIGRMTLEDYRQHPPESQDLLFFGVPEPRDLPPVSMANSLRLAPKQAGYAGLLLLRQLNQPQRVVAVYDPGEAQFAEPVARKIPHYGKYSQLEFSAGTIHTRRIIEPDSNPLHINLKEQEPLPR